MTGFNISKENHIHEAILLKNIKGIHNAIVINYYMLNAKHYIYLEKLKDENKKVDLT